MTAAGANEAAITQSPQRYPALPTQHGMVLNSMRCCADGVDVLQITLDWPEPLLAEPFEAAWQEVMRRNPVLRTGFELHSDYGLVQAPDPAAALDIAWYELPAPPATGEDAAFEEFLRADRRRPFDVTRPPLIRLSVLRRPRPAARPAENKTDGSLPPAHRSVLTFSHALLDGRSMRLLVEEVSRCYAARLAGRPVAPPRRPQFAEFVRWWQMADQAEPTGSEQFWTPYLADAELPRALPGYLGTGRPAAAEPRKADTALTAADSERLRELARQAGLGASTVLTAAWALLRARYGGVDDVVLALTRSCRHASIPDADQVMGLLINTVPLRVRIDPRWTVTELLAAVDAGIAAIRDHQRTPMAEILSRAGLPVDTPLIDSLVMFDRQRLGTGLATEPTGPVDARVDRLPSYPLSVCGYGEDELQLGMIWDGRRLADGSAQLMLAQLRITLAEFAADPSRPLAQLSLGAGEEAQLRRQWNAAPAAGSPSSAGYPRDASVPALFAARVAERPDASAVEFDAGSWSYAELDRRSTELAWGLRERGVGTDVPVAVALPRGPELIAALLAVLKAGGAYLPIDQGSPPARVAGMIAGAALVIVTGETADAVPAVAGVPRVALAELSSGRFDALPAGLAHPLSLAYLSFTSGSTGVPKGVAVPHRAVVRLVSDPTFATLGPGQRLLQLAPVAFDASTLEIWGALLTGATLITAPPGPLGLPEIAGLLRGRGVSLAWLTAGLFHQLAEADAGALAEVEQLLAGGDVLNAEAVRTVLEVRAGRPLVNGYGPTENTTFTTCHSMTDPAGLGAAVPIGRPIQHTSVQLLDADLRPVPVGVAGELYAGGDGLARGYSGNAAATARAFVPDPAGSGERLYRTGDLARWRADGVLEFLGRADDQVKVRGFRVEPGEVEAVLRGHPGVREAVVLVRGDGAQRHLVGYVLPADGADPGTLTPALLREYLSYRLPDYLVPAGFAVLERFPLNANGKVDRAALPEPERETRQDASPPPEGETEVRLAEMWRLLLAAESIGRTDNFFALGGNSLSAARLMFRIREVFGVELPMGAFYTAPALAECAAAIDAARTAVPVGTPASGGIGRRSRDGYRVGGPSGGAAAGAAEAAAPHVAAPSRPAGIGRRDRSAFRVVSAPPAPEPPVTPPATGQSATGQPATGQPATEQPAMEQLAPHLAPLTENWALWRTVCLRAAGFPLDLLDAIGDPALAALADAAATAPERMTAYQAEFPAAVGRLTRALHEAASLPALREAVAWQNRRALDTGIDALVRRGPQPASRNTKHRQHEALVASYLQRYCAKNDTIGFFGPVSWARLGDGAGIRIEHRDPAEPVKERVTYLEGWAVRAVLAEHVPALRPWLVPRRMPFLGLDRDSDGDLLRLPLAPAVRLSPAEAAVLAACDGIRTASEVAERVLAGPAAGLGSAADVFAVLAALADNHRLTWTVDVPPQDIRPERTARALLARVTDDGVRAPAAAAVDALVESRDALAAAAGDPERVVAAMAGLERTFTQHAKAEPTRRAGELYAGRTLAYEECLRADTVSLGADAVDGIRDALGLVLDSARWFTAVTGALYARRFTEIYREISKKRAPAQGSAAVPFAEFWLLANDALFDQPPPLAEPAVRALQQRWASILRADADQQRIQLTSAELADAVARAFPAQPPVWPMAVHHSPDLMIAGRDAAAGGRHTWVLGEIHPSIVTTRYASWLEFADDPAAVRAGMHADLGRDVVFVAETAVEGGVCSRLSNVLASENDLRLVFAADSCGYDPRRLLAIGDCDVIDSPTGLRVRRRDGSLELGLLEVVGDLLSAVVVQTFHPLPRGSHAPRVSIDDLVVSRESWTLPASEPPFADTADEALRYSQARAWATGHGLPRYVFLRFTGERKPIYADLTSLASIDLIARGLRRCRRVAGEAATVSVVEMLPTPDQAWLVDADGRRYSAELRMVVTDRHRGQSEQRSVKQPEQKQEG